MIEKRVYYHNGTEYIEIDNLSIIDGLPIEETIDDTLDSATLIVKNEFESFLELWYSIKIVSGALNKCFSVSDIFSKRESDIEVKYQHTISLIEPTKYLEKVYCSSMSFTNKNDTLLMQLQKALINAEIISEYESPRFKLSNALINRLANEPGRDFFFEKSTLREIIDGILGVLDLRCEVYEITDFNNNIVIDYYDINARKNLIDLGEILDKQTVENIEYLGSDIEAYGENSFSGSRSAIYHPSPNGWDTFKTNEATLTTDNAAISTAFPIEEIIEFIMPPMEVNVRGTLTSGGGTLYGFSLTIPNINVSKNVVDKDIYDILKETSPSLVMTNELYKNNTIYYVRASEEIKRDFYRTLFMTKDPFENAIKNAIWREKTYIESMASVNFGEAFTLQEIFGVPFLETADWDWNNKKIAPFRFRIKYIPYIDAHTRISKSNYSKVPSTLIDNQSDKVIDLERYGDNLSSTVNRLGNKTLTIDKVHNSISEVFEVQDYTADNYVLTKRTIALYNHVIKAHYEFTKDFNSINERIGIDRAKRIYNIPLENFKRDILIKEYMFASFNGAYENDGINELFMNVFNPSTKNPITNALVMTKWLYDGGTIFENSGWLELSVAPYAMATSLHFRFKFQDNYSAGMSTENQVVGGKKQVPNPYVKTTGEERIGEHNQIRIMLINDKLATRSELYNDIKLLPKTNISWYTNTKKLIDTTFKVEKDAYEHMSYVYQLETLSNDKDIIIGNSIAKLHPLVSDVSYSLNVYTSETEIYSQGDVKAKGFINNDLWFSAIGNSLTIIDGVNAPYDPIDMPGVKSWCVADKFGNILVAVNKVGETNISNNVRFNHKIKRN